MVGIVRQITMSNSGVIFSIEMTDSANRDLVLQHNTNSGAFVPRWQNLFHLTCTGGDLKIKKLSTVVPVTASAKKKTKK